VDEWGLLNNQKIFLYKIKFFRFHKIANVNKALDFIMSKGVKLMVGAEGIKKKIKYFKIFKYFNS
jgi:hypothetical protein